MLPYDKFYRKLKKRLTGQSALAILELLTTHKGSKMLNLIFLKLQRYSLAITAGGQMDILALPLEREHWTRVRIAHARTEAEILRIDAEIRRLQRGNGICSEV